MHVLPHLSRARITALCLLALACGTAAGQTITNLGVLPGKTSSEGRGLSGDGTAVVGVSSSANRAFRWTSGGGMQDLGTVSGGPTASAYGTNSDGSVVVGFSNNRAFRWTTSGGMPQGLSTLGGSSSSAYGVSRDGLVVVGDSLTGGGATHAFKWTSGGGMQDLHSTGTSSTMRGANSDGSVLVGQSNLHASRWTQAGGVQDLGVLAGRTNAIAVATSSDGSVVVGYSFGGAGATEAFRWTSADGMVGLGTLAASFSTASAVSADGAMVVGSSNGKAFLWHAVMGMVDLNEYLPTKGVDLTGWTLDTCDGISDSKGALTGRGTFGGQTRAWVVTGLSHATFSKLDLLAGWDETYARGISADGSAVAGYAYTDGLAAARASRWTPAGGAQDLGTLGSPSAIAYGISGNGLTPVGFSADSSSVWRAFSWTGGGGMADLGVIPDNSLYNDYYATGANSDGSVIVGVEDLQSGASQAFQWSAGAMTVLSPPSGFTGAEAHGVSADGSAVAGQIYSGATVRAARWSNGVATNLGALGYSLSFGEAISADGTVVVGECNGPFEIAFRWSTSGGGATLGALPGSTGSAALGVSGNGALVGGASYGNPIRAVLWTQSLGMVDLNVLLPSLGVDLTGWTLNYTWAVSADGTSAAGDGDLNGLKRAWVVRGLPFACSGAPVMIVPPAEATVCTFSNPSLNVVAAGPVTSYRWRKDGVDLVDGLTGPGSTIAGATTATLTITYAQSVDTGTYDCVVANLCGSVTSAGAVLTVCVADYDCNGYVNGDDFDFFMEDFFFGNQSADVDGNTFVNGDDFDYLIEHFFYGC